MVLSILPMAAYSSSLNVLEVSPFASSLDNVNESVIACKSTLVVKIDAYNIAFMPTISRILFKRLPKIAPMVRLWYLPLESNIFLTTEMMANPKANMTPTIPIPIYTPLTESWLKNILIRVSFCPLYMTGDSPVKIIIIFSISFIA